jgi:hypothetical protein
LVDGSLLETLKVELDERERDGKLLVMGIEGVDVKDCDVLEIDSKDCDEESGCADEAADEGAAEDAEAPVSVVGLAGVVEGAETSSGVFVRICCVEKTWPLESTSICWT